MRTDESLAVGIQRGNASDMTELVDRYYDPLLRYLYRMCGGNQPLAEDIVQESFLRMMRGITTFDTNRAFKPWLYSIATNIVRNHFNKADTRYAHNPEEDFEYTSDQFEPEATLVLSENIQQVFDALMQVPEIYRSVVVLVYYEEMSQKDIAQILNISVGTVKSRLSRGLKQLRTIMQTHELKDVSHEK